MISRRCHLRDEAEHLDLALSSNSQEVKFLFTSSIPRDSKFLGLVLNLSIPRGSKFLILRQGSKTKYSSLQCE